MTHRPLLLVPALALFTGAAASAADAPGPNVIGTGTNVMEVGPGKIQGGGRSVYIQGLVDLDAIQQGNYTDGNNDRSDHRSEGWYRAELGTRISVDERVEVQVTIAGQGVMGNSRATNNTDVALGGVTNDPANGQSGNAVLDDAFVKLKDFLNYRELAVDAGRMPVSWNLRKDHAAFLYDSRADYGTVTSWDGIRASYNLDTVNITPYVYRLPDDSQLYGAVLDWEPAKSGDDRLFFTLSANLERNVTMRDGTLGDSLQTYYVGGDADLASFELFGEFAMQNGSQNNNVDFKGFAFSGGLDWHADRLVVGFQGDYFTGDKDPNDGENHAIINNWEGVSNTYIVESEKYGEQSRLLVGNLQAYKGKVELALDDKKRVRIKSVYGFYKTNETVAGASGNKFGQEADLHIAWDYTRNATITLLGGVFKPDDAYRAARTNATPTVTANDDLIYLIGANLLVKF
ncbi:MAG TPA: alginate export family protein [Planctomycetota bacterium]|nr:alginate export family protein [Planctomycetota bacterium]